MQGRNIGCWATPLHAETETIARRMIGRCHDAGIEIVLVSTDGEVQLVHPGNGVVLRSAVCGLRAGPAVAAGHGRLCGASTTSRDPARIPTNRLR